MILYLFIVAYLLLFDLNIPIPLTSLLCPFMWLRKTTCQLSQARMISPYIYTLELEQGLTLLRRIRYTQAHGVQWRRIVALGGWLGIGQQPQYKITPRLRFRPSLNMIQYLRIEEVTEWN